ncbi:MAG: hypothetical protein KBD26_03700 [Candidatus Pacebacteria bacterium]|nr:hypothetical protein [Candidatus Paceibacterota bacterium]MBP9772908.1 hypothetical protein [Candidatus Paceibacterota bacterium]QQR76401.1 MAG: hypothetical protein IPJ63_02770 [Candidatus Nomurabacteria bacterium]
MPALFHKALASTTDCTSSIDGLLAKINQYLINPLIVFMFAVALAYFMFGVVQFLTHQESSDERAKGQQHMLYGVIGMFIMIAVFTIMRILANTLGGDTTCLPTTV